MKKFSSILTAVCVSISAVLAVYMFWQRLAHLMTAFPYDHFSVYIRAYLNGAHLTDSLSYDELYSLATAWPGLKLSYIWHEILLKDVNLPLYNLMLYGWNHIFPTEPFYLRLFNTLPSLAAVPTAYFFAPDAWPKLKRFMLTALTAGSFILVTFGFNIRAYSFAVWAGMVFTLLALRMIDLFAHQKNPSAKYWSTFFIIGLFGSYLHYFCAGLFFITALVVFLYSCYYKTGRATAFWGTAAVFAAWFPWVINTYLLMSAPSGSWWYAVPVMRSTWDILQFIFGSPSMVGYGLIFLIVSAVSLVHTQKKRLLLNASIVLPVAQIVLLVAVVAVVSLKYNLWIDRYFVALMPAILVLTGSCLYHLYERHRLLIVLLPLILLVWINLYWNMYALLRAEYTGLKDAFSFISQNWPNQPVYVDTAKTGYPEKALQVMLHYYAPNPQINLIALSKENAPQTAQTPKPPVLMPLCTQYHLMQFSFDYNLEEDREPYLFGSDVCVFTAHPVPEARP